MKKITMIITVLSISFGLSLNVWATPIIPVEDTDDGSDVYEVINDLLGENYTNNADVENRRVVGDEWWATLGDESPVMLVNLSAGHRNTIGYYTDLGVGENRNEIFGPTEPDTFKQAGSGTSADPFHNGGYISTSEAFGFYLKSEYYSYGKNAWLGYTL